MLRRSDDPWFHRKHKSRAMRGFEFGGPTRTRTVDQRIMSHRMTLRGLISLGEGRQRYNSANQLLILSFC